MDTATLATPAETAPPSRQFYRDATAAYFRAHPLEWIPFFVFLPIGGACAWRSRISDCRTELDMTIETRVDSIREDDADGRYLRHRKTSFYRFVPKPSAATICGRNGQIGFALEA